MTRILRSALAVLILAGAATLAVQPARADGDWHDGWHGGWHRGWDRDRGDWHGPRWGVVVAPRPWYPPPPVYYAPPPPPPPVYYAPPPPPVVFAPGFTVGVGFR